MNYISYLLLGLIIVSIITYIESRPKYKIGKSTIQGNGAICVRNIKKGEKIGLVITRDEKNDKTYITPYLGVFINHKLDDNTYLKKINGSIDTYYIYAKKNIYIGEEITSNYDGETIPSFIEGSKSYYV